MMSEHIKQRYCFEWVCLLKHLQLVVVSKKIVLYREKFMFALISSHPTVRRGVTEIWLNKYPWLKIRKRDVPFMDFYIFMDDDAPYSLLFLFCFFFGQLRTCVCDVM